MPYTAAKLQAKIGIRRKELERLARGLLNDYPWCKTDADRARMCDLYVERLVEILKPEEKRKTS